MVLTKRLQLRTDENFHNVIIERAEEKGSTISDYVRDLILEDLKNRNVEEFNLSS